MIKDLSTLLVSAGEYSVRVYDQEEDYDDDFAYELSQLLEISLTPTPSSSVIAGILI